MFFAVQKEYGRHPFLDLLLSSNFFADGTNHISFYYFFQFTILEKLVPRAVLRQWIIDGGMQRGIFALVIQM